MSLSSANALAIGIRRLSTWLVASLAVTLSSYATCQELLVRASNQERASLPENVRSDPRVREALKTGDLEAVNAAIGDVVRTLPLEDKVSFESGELTILLPAAPKDDAELAELIRTAAGPKWGRHPLDTDLWTPEMLAAAKLSDPEARKRAFADAIASLPERLQKLLAGGYVFAEDLVDEPREQGDGSPRLPLRDALLLLTEHQQQALRVHARLIDEDAERAFSELVRSMPRESRQAALALLSMSHHHADIMRAEAKGAEMARAARERGYVESWEDVPVASRLLANIRRHQAFPRSDTGPDWEDAHYAQFELLDPATWGDPPAARSRHEIVRPDTQVFVGPWDGGSATVFADTIFEAPLAVFAYPVARVRFGDVNLTIAGHDASLSLSKHKSGLWTTTVSAFDGRHLHVFELATKLQGEQRDPFVRFAREVVESSAGRDLSYGALFPDRQAASDE